MNRYLAALQEIVSETLWPTRCVICDKPNTLLCSECWQTLTYVDQYRSCPTCGAINGKAICCECNPISLADKGLEHIPLDAFTSLCQSNEQTIKLITTYKDRGEQRLAQYLALLLAPLVNPGWPQDLIITTIPPRAQALKHRGFDHMHLVAQEVSAQTAIPFIPLMGQKKTKDQRHLNAQQRRENKRHSFFTITTPPEAVLLLDDVCTTGATLYAAAETLKEAGALWVGAITLLRGE